MKRAGLCILGAVVSLLLVGDVVDAEDEPKKVKRTIHAIELATSTDENFSGNVVLRLAEGATGHDLTYYWGGKCKGTKVAQSRLDLMVHAMEKKYAVEIPSYPIRHGDQIYMCMKSIRVLAE